MKIPLLVVTHVFVLIFSCALSDVATEEFVQTTPIVTTSTYPTLDSESETEVTSNNSAATSSLIAEAEDSRQESYDITMNSNSRLAASAKITWNPVSSVSFSTVSLTKNTDYENTSLQSSTPHSVTNKFIYQTPPSIFENLDHEENELDTDTKATDMSKGLKTTLNTGLPLLYALEETVSLESQTDISSVKPDNLDLISESEREPISGRITDIDSFFEHNMKNSTGTPLSLVSEHTTGDSFLISTTDISNTELSAESTLNKEATVISDSNLFSITSTSTNLDGNNTGETENKDNATFINDGRKLSLDSSSTTSIAELGVENRDDETTLYYSSLEPNSTYSESSTEHEPIKMLSFSEKSHEGLELTSRLHLETVSDSSIFDKDTDSSFLDFNTDNLTTENIPTTISDTLTKTSPFIISTLRDSKSFPHTFSDLNSSQENYGSRIEDTSPHSSYATSIRSTDQENLSSFTYSATTEDSFTTISEIFVSNKIQPNNSVLSGTEEYQEDLTVNVSISDDTEMEKTTLPIISSTVHYTLLDGDDISQTTASSFKMDRSTVSNIEKEASMFTTVKPTLLEITTSLFSPISIFEGTSKLSTTTDLSKVNGYYFPSTNTHISTVTVNDNEESNTVTYLTSDKHNSSEDSTDSYTELSTVPESVSNPLPPLTNAQSLTTDSGDAMQSKYSTVTFLPTHEDAYVETSSISFAEQSTVSQTVPYHPLSSTVFEQSSSSTTNKVFTSLNPLNDLSTEETLTTGIERYTDEISTSISDSFSMSASVDTSSMPTETHREGKHIPFSTTSTIKVTDPTSDYSFPLLTTEKTPHMKAAVNDTEVQYMQIKIEDIDPIDRTNMITAIIQFPADSVNKKDMKVKLARTHQWLDKVLTKEFQNWTGDPFQKDEEQEVEIPFGNISIFYVKPTPETNASHITLTFIVYNIWRNRTLPVDFVPGTLNFYSKELKESINASAAYFYHGLPTENYDFLSAVFDKYGIIIFTICLAVVGITILVCIIIFNRKKQRQSIHYFADNKLQQNLQEAVGIDLTPASIILQDEKEEKGSKICDDEGWLVPITDVPLAEENNVPNIQDTKL